MDILDILSLGTTFLYSIKIEQKLKQNIRQFGSGNLAQQKQRKGNPNPQNKGQRKEGQPEDNHFIPQEKKDNGKMKKDIVKWCDFHNRP
jgi:hypothetical protein